MFGNSAVRPQDAELIRVPDHCFCFVLVTVNSLTVEPGVLFVDENWQLHKPLNVEICGDSAARIKILSGNEDGVFGLVPVTQQCATLKLGKHLDADLIAESKAADGMPIRGQSFSLVFEETYKKERAGLDIQVVDVNDNAPEFVNLPSEIELTPKELNIGRIVWHLETHDPDTGIGSVVRFSLAGSDNFAIVNEKCSNAKCTADLKISKTLQPGRTEMLEITARDGASITKSFNEKRAVVKVSVASDTSSSSAIETIPNLPPVFRTVFEYPIRIQKNLRLSSKIVKVSATVEGDAEIIYSVEPNDWFEINSNSGWISLKKSLDDIAGSEISLIVKAKEKIGDSFGLETSMDLKIFVESDEGNRPTCAARQYSAVFNKISSKLLMNDEIKVYNADQNSKFRVLLRGKHSEAFSVHPSMVQGSANVQIHVLNQSSLRQVNDMELQLQIELYSSDAESIPADSCKLLIKLFDPTRALSGSGAQHASPIIPLEHSEPTILEEAIPTVDIEENAPATCILNLTHWLSLDSYVVRSDITGNGAEKFLVNHLGQLCTIGPLDAEKLETTILNVAVETETGKSNAHDFRVNVLDQNEYAPQFLKSKYSVTLDCSLDMSKSILTIEAIDYDVTKKFIVYDLSENAKPYFAINDVNTSDGAAHVRLTHRPPVMAGSHGFEFEVIARDAGNPPKEGRVPVTVYLKSCAPVEAIKANPIGGFNKFGKNNRSEQAQSKFVPWHYNVELKENTPEGVEILQLKMPNSADSVFAFELVEDNHNGTLQTNILRLQKNGSVVVTAKIDYEMVKEVNAKVYAVSNRQRLHFATIRVIVQDENDNRPKFRIPNGHKILLSEWTPVGHVLPLPYPLAEDNDTSPSFSIIRYSLISNAEIFRINENTSEIILARNLALISNDELKLVIRAVDNPANSSDTEETIVQNVAEVSLIVSIARRPLQDTLGAILDSLPNRVEVWEDEDVGSILISANAVLPPDVRLQTSTSKHFSVVNGDLKLSKSLRGFGNRTLCVQVRVSKTSLKPGDMPTKNVCFFVKPSSVVVRRTTTSRPLGLATVIIHSPEQDSEHTFKDNDDNSLAINASLINSKQPTTKLDYKLMELPNQDWTNFVVTNDGILKPKNEFDFEQKDNYQLTAEVCADDNPNRLINSCARVRFTIRIERPNPICPYFNRNSDKPEKFVTSENLIVVNTTGIILGTFDAAIYREPNSVCYRLLDDHKSTFVIPNAHKPELFAKKSLDREFVAEYNLTIMAYDCNGTGNQCSEINLLKSAHVNSSKSSFKTAVVEVDDVNDNIPLFSQRHYFGSVVDRMTHFGETILQLNAVDLDKEDQGLRYFLSSAVHTENDMIAKKKSPFTVNYTTGAIVSHLLYSSDMPRSYSFRVAVRDAAEHEDVCEVSVIDYTNQIEFSFAVNPAIIEKELVRIERLLSDSTSLKAIIDQMVIYPNSTTITAHFLDKRRLAVSQNEIKRLWRENNSTNAEKAREELKSHYKQILDDITDLPEEDEEEFNFASSTFESIVGLKRYLPNMSDVESSVLISGASLLVLLTILVSLFCWMMCHSSSRDNVRLRDRPWRQTSESYYGEHTLGRLVMDPTLVKMNTRQNRSRIFYVSYFIAFRLNDNEEPMHQEYSTPHVIGCAVTNPHKSTEF
ncbi:cadherin-99C [Ditylenchus destructor]|nr:cadherin-99C [Ditylenchus destructor]